MTDTDANLIPEPQDMGAGRLCIPLILSGLALAHLIGQLVHPLVQSVHLVQHLSVDGPPNVPGKPGPRIDFDF